MTELYWIALAGAVGFAAYTYLGYPILLWLLGRVRRVETPTGPVQNDWPAISISLPVFNEEHQIAATLEALLAMDYPAHRLQIVVVSDASTDGTDAIVRTFAERGVHLVRQPQREGKTAAEDFAAPHLTGDIVVNTDASIRIHHHSLKRLVAPFVDPGIGLASGRDVSVGEDTNATEGEASYVGYEMAVRDLETRVGSIVGASGCFYAIRRSIHLVPIPPSLSRDFAAALNTRERGLRAVSVPDATCTVPRTAAIRKEYRRKVRTISRGMETLWNKRALLNPFRYGIFSWMVFSHKVCRWALPWVALIGLAGLAGLSALRPWARLGLAGAALLLVLALLGWVFEDRRLPRIISIPAFAVMANAAAFHAGLRALTGDRNAIWQPTRRPT